MVLRFLGESVTDSNGLAVLSEGYTGTGAGLVDIIAQTTIDESSVQSEPYIVYDCFISDGGVTGNKNSGCYGDSGLGISTDSNGTSLSNSSNAVLRYFMDNSNVGSDINDITSAFCLEFDIVSFTGKTQFGFYQQGGGEAISTINTIDLGLTGACHFKMEHDGSHYSVWVDSTKKMDNIAHTWNEGRFLFMPYAASSGSTEFKYKNFKCYPI